MAGRMKRSVEGGAEFGRTTEFAVFGGRAGGVLARRRGKMGWEIERNSAGELDGRPELGREKRSTGGGGGGGEAWTAGVG